MSKISRVRSLLNLDETDSPYKNRCNSNRFKYTSMNIDEHVRIHSFFNKSNYLSLQISTVHQSHNPDPVRDPMTEPFDVDDVLHSSPTNINSTSKACKTTTKEVPVHCNLVPGETDRHLGKLKTTHP